MAKHAGGRPPFPYSRELAERICFAIATSSKGITDVCASSPDFPSADTIIRWKLNNDEFSALYTRAKQLQADFMTEEIIKLSDDATHDLIMGADGVEKPNMAAIQRARLGVDSRKWFACKLIPKVYGDRAVTETTITHVLHEDALKALD